MNAFVFFLMFYIMFTVTYVIASHLICILNLFTAFIKVFNEVLSVCCKYIANYTIYGIYFEPYLDLRWANERDKKKRFGIFLI